MSHSELVYVFILLGDGIILLLDHFFVPHEKLQEYY